MVDERGYFHCIIIINRSHIGNFQKVIQAQQGRKATNSRSSLEKHGSMMVVIPFEIKLDIMKIYFNNGFMIIK
jgi:hypothetical protein